MHDAEIRTVVEADYEFAEDEWAAIWQTAQNEGLGAGRSQGYGTFIVTRWDLQKTVRALKKAA